MAEPEDELLNALQREGVCLRFSVETEKLGNGERYSSLGSLKQVTDILAGEGLSPADVSTSLSSTAPARLRIFVLTRLVRP